jgi:hypothetical protein
LNTLKLIGKENERKEDLIGRAMENPLIRDVLEGKKSKKQIQNEELYESAATYVKAVEIKYGRGGFIYNGDSTEYPNTHDNLLLAINKRILGKKKEAEKIVEILKRDVGISKIGLIYDFGDDGKKRLYTHDSLLLAIDELLAGHVYKATDIFESIDHNIQYDALQFLRPEYKKNIGLMNTLSKDSMLNCIYKKILGKYPSYDTFSLDKKVREVMAGIERRFKDEKEYPLIRDIFDKEKSTKDAGTNSLYAAANHLIGYSEESIDIITMMQMDIGITQVSRPKSDGSKSIDYKLMQHAIHDKTLFAEDTLCLAFALFTMAGALDKYKFESK